MNQVKVPEHRSIDPAGFRVLVYPDPLEETTKGGIILARQDERLHKAAQQTGTLVAVGPIAWKAFDKPGFFGKLFNRWFRWAKVGQRVFYVKYGGMFVEDPETKDVYVLLNDEDISGTIRDKP